MYKAKLNYFSIEMRDLKLYCYKSA